MFAALPGYLKDLCTLCDCLQPGVSHTGSRFTSRGGVPRLRKVNVSALAG